jgi:hypothetical protein
LDFVRSQKDGASNKIKDLTEVAIMVSEDEPKVKYVPPHTGTMFMHVADSFASIGAYSVLSAVDHSNMMEVAKTGVDSVSTVLEFCIQNSYLRLKEARYIYNAMFAEVRDAAKALSKILPRMALPEEAKLLMLQQINFDKVALRKLERMLGENTLRVILGEYNGYFDLDLSNKMDRLCLTKLLMQNDVYQKTCQRHRVFEEAEGACGDLSQNGDWSAFRNAVINGARAHLSADLFKLIPVKGFVSFDFCGDNKAPSNSSIIKDSRCINLLVSMGLVQDQLRDFIQRELNEYSSLSKTSVAGNGTFIPVNDPTRAEQIQECMSKFYDRLLTRHQQYVRARSLEHIKFGADSSVGREAPDEDDDSDNDSVDSLSHVVFDESEKRLVDSQKNIEMSRLEAGTVPLSNQTKYEQIEETRKRQLVRRDRRSKGVTSGSSHDDMLKVLERPSRALEDPTGSASAHVASPDSPVQGRTTSTLLPCKSVGADDDDNAMSAMASRIMSAIVDILCRVYIRARHLALITKWFYIGRHHKTRHFGSYRVELVVALFSRVVDIHNFDLVLRVLMPYEHAQVICRLGMLNLFNPLKPEGSICLNIGRHEERTVSKMLIALKIKERGDAWRNYSFRLDFDSVKIPAWELPEPWLVNETLPDKGLLSLTYHCGDGAKKGGCADVALRKSFLNLV